MLTSVRRSSAAAAANRSRSPRSPVSTRSCRPVSGSTSRSSPTSASSCSRGSRTSTASTVCRPASRSSGGRQSIGPRKSETTTTSARWRATRSASSSASRKRAGARRRQLAQQAERVQQRTPALARTLDDGLGSERDRAEPVPAARRCVADRDRDPFGDVRLSPLAGPERHRRRRVEHEPRDEHALGELDPNVRFAGAGRDVPLDPANVVAGLVRTHLPQLAADAGERGAIVPGQQPVDAAPDRQLERTQRRGRERAWPRLCGRANRSERVVGHSDGVCAAEVDLRRRHRCEHLIENRVRRDLLGERAVGEHEAVPERVADERVEIARDDVVAAADQGERPGGRDQADRPARAGAERDVVGDVAEAVLGGRRVAVATSTVQLISAGST